MKLSHDAQEELLIDEVHEVDTVARLADQLSIVALYRVVEVKHRSHVGA